MNFLKITLLFILFSIGLHSMLLAQKTGDITVNFTDLRNSEGQLMISVHLNSDGFPKTNWYRKLYYKNITSPTYAVILKDIPYGTVAISILHDEDLSGDMTFNFIHIPKEGFGFYKNYEVSLSAPDFEEVYFELNQPQMKIVISPQY